MREIDEKMSPIFKQVVFFSGLLSNHWVGKERHDNKFSWSPKYVEWPFPIVEWLVVDICGNEFHLIRPLLHSHVEKMYMIAQNALNTMLGDPLRGYNGLVWDEAGFAIGDENE